MMKVTFKYCTYKITLIEFCYQKLKQVLKILNCQEIQFQNQTNIVDNTFLTTYKFNYWDILLFMSLWNTKESNLIMTIIFLVYF